MTRLQKRSCSWGFSVPDARRQAAAIKAEARSSGKGQRQRPTRRATAVSKARLRPTRHSPRTHSRARQNDWDERFACADIRHAVRRRRRMRNVGYWTTDSGSSYTNARAGLASAAAMTRKRDSGSRMSSKPTPHVHRARGHKLRCYDYARTSPRHRQRNLQARIKSSTTEVPEREAWSARSLQMERANDSPIQQSRQEPRFSSAEPKLAACPGIECGVGREGGATLLPASTSSPSITPDATKDQSVRATSPGKRRLRVYGMFRLVRRPKSTWTAAAPIWRRSGPRNTQTRRIRTTRWPSPPPRVF